jgi:hypothetical protein
LSLFIDALWRECTDDLKVKRIASEPFRSIVTGRQEDQRKIIIMVLKQVQERKQLMREHALAWLIGHSIGLPYLDELLRLQRKF